ncbi:MAG TPA: alpha/beta fold hydrolase [Chthonomonadales bacterium]|nr:alpha/beta fold hydrolase [Chthonomonadales bacterium]
MSKYGNPVREATTNPVKLTRISIPNGPVTLAGLIYEPDFSPRNLCVVLAHGFTASKESMDLLANYLSLRGYPCLTFDFRGHKLGGSTGEIHHAIELVSDIEAAITWATHAFHRPHCALVGHSMGALIALVAARREEVAGVAAIATGTHPSRGFDTAIGAAMLLQRTDYVLGVSPRILLEQFDCLTRYLEELGQKPVLFVAARGDGLVKPTRVRELAARFGPQVEFVEVEGGHLEAPDRARGIVAAWLDKISSCLGEEMEERK